MREFKMKFIKSIFGLSAFFLFLAFSFISCVSTDVCYKVCAPGSECELVCKSRIEWGQ